MTLCHIVSCRRILSTFFWTCTWQGQRIAREPEARVWTGPAQLKTHALYESLWLTPWLTHTSCHFMSLYVSCVWAWPSPVKGRDPDQLPGGRPGTSNAGAEDSAETSKSSNMVNMHQDIMVILWWSNDSNGDFMSIYVGKKGMMRWKMESIRSKPVTLLDGFHRFPSF